VFHIDVVKVDRDVYVTTVIHVCCKLLFPMFYPIFLDVCCKCVYLDVAYVHTYVCKCFIWMLCMFLQWFQVFLGVFASISDVCFKCCICLQTYVVSIAF
jgi:hypothetical protein